MKYRKKPVVVEAVQFTGDNAIRISDFVNGEFAKEEPPETYVIINSSIYPQEVSIVTLEGTMKAEPGDYVIKGVNNEFYPCKPDIFAKTYELAEG